MPTAAVAWLLLLAGIGPAGAGWLYYLVLLAILLVFTATCVLFGDVAEAAWRKDPSQVVADETAGMCLPLLFLPAWAVDTAWEATAVIAAAFLLFRAFDIVKPWPAGRLQRLPAGWGIVIDDLVAGAMALAVMQVVLRTLVVDS
jgi:phosphatidylglycerophosphatase A